MRVFLFVLMVVLMPLRGWVSDAMATSMAAAEVASSAHSAMAIKNIASKAENIGANGVFYLKNKVTTGHQLHQSQISGDLHAAATDCAGHSDALDLTAGGEACGTCAACVACQLSAIQLSPAISQASSLPRPALLLALRDYSSADMALGQKPPIS